MGFVSETVEAQPWDKRASPGILGQVLVFWCDWNGLPSRLMCEDDGTVLRLYIDL